MNITDFAIDDFSMFNPADQIAIKAGFEAARSGNKKNPYVYGDIDHDNWCLGFDYFMNNVERA
jgi:hypothetical protein